MAEYNIGAVARLTGISTHNLRAWEKRHQLHPGERSDGGRRVYNEADVERLRLIKQCTDLGHSISKLAGLSVDELKSNLAQLAQAGRSNQPAPAVTRWMKRNSPRNTCSSSKKPPPCTTC